jgi:hypothetical protein
VEKLIPLGIVLGLLVGLGGIFALVIRWAKKSRGRAAVAGWGLQLFGAGMDPLPPPQEQLEEVTRQGKIKKASESGDPAG